MYYGQGNAVDIAYRTAQSALALAPVKGAAGEFLKQKAESTLNMAAPVIEGARGNKDKAAQETRKFAINQAFDSTMQTIERAGGQSSAKWSKGLKGLGVAKAALNYDMALGNRFDSYLTEKTDTLASQFQIQTEYQRKTRLLKQNLESALTLLADCAATPDK